MTQPNILVIMADQLAPHWTGTYGHALAKTPHMDALAQRGMRFDAAYCNAPHHRAVEVLVHGELFA